MIKLEDFENENNLLDPKNFNIWTIMTNNIFKDLIKYVCNFKAKWKDNFRNIKLISNILNYKIIFI